MKILCKISGGCGVTYDNTPHTLSARQLSRLTCKSENTRNQFSGWCLDDDNARMSASSLCPGSG